MRRRTDDEDKATRKVFVRRPLFVTVLSVGVLAASGFAGYRQLTAARFAQVVEVKPVAEDSGQTGFDVRYRLGDKEDMIRLPYDPGPRIPVGNGKLLLEPPAR